MAVPTHKSLLYQEKIMKHLFALIVREALSLNDIPKAEIEEILKVIHRSGEESA